MDVYGGVCMCTDVYGCVSMCTYVCMYVCIYAGTCACMHAHTNTTGYVYVYTGKNIFQFINVARFCLISVACLVDRQKSSEITKMRCECNSWLNPRPAILQEDSIFALRVAGASCRRHAPRRLKPRSLH